MDQKTDMTAAEWSVAAINAKFMEQANEAASLRKQLDEAQEREEAALIACQRLSLNKAYADRFIMEKGLSREFYASLPADHEYNKLLRGEWGSPASPSPVLRDANTAPAPDEPLLTIIARSIGRTTGETNYIQRARDVLRSVREADLTLPAPITAPAPAKYISPCKNCGKGYGAHAGVGAYCPDGQSFHVWKKYQLPDYTATAPAISGGELPKGIWCECLKRHVVACNCPLAAADRSK